LVNFLFLLNYSITNDNVFLSFGTDQKSKPRHKSDSGDQSIPEISFPMRNIPVAG
jgi:hypothetical protein